MGARQKRAILALLVLLGVGFVLSAMCGTLYVHVVWGGLVEGFDWKLSLRFTGILMVGALVASVIAVFAFDRATNSTAVSGTRAAWIGALTGPSCALLPGLLLLGGTMGWYGVALAVGITVLAVGCDFVVLRFFAPGGLSFRVSKTNVVSE